MAIVDFAAHTVIKNTNVERNKTANETIETTIAIIVDRITTTTIGETTTAIATTTTTKRIT
jgi:hypothetical protein